MSLERAIEFIVPGTPQGKARPRFARTARGVRTYTPEKTASYQQTVRAAFYSSLQSRGIPFKGGVNGNTWFGKKPLRVIIRATFAPVASATRATRGLMELGRLRPTKKPDCDNIAKAVLDALNGHAYKDDSQVVQLEVHKLYGKVAAVRVDIIPIGDDEDEQDEPKGP